MASPFDEHLAEMQTELQDEFGEAISVKFPAQKAGSYGGAEAEDRLPEAVIDKAIFSLSPRTKGIKGANVGSEMVGATRIGLGATEFWISAADYSANPIVKDDIITRTDADGQPSYDVVLVIPTGKGDAHVMVTKRGQT